MRFSQTRQWLKYIVLFICILSLKAFAQVGPLPCGAISSITTWREDFPYSIGQVVILDGVTYQSLSNNNLNLNPCTYSGSQWSNVISGGGGSYSLATYSTIGLAPQGTVYVVPSQITGSITDAWQAITAAVGTLPSGGGTVDATGLGDATYTVTSQLTGMNVANKPVVLILDPRTTFLINTSFTSPTNSPASCAVPIGGTVASGGAIIVRGQNSLNGNFVVGPNAKVWDVICNGNFGGVQQSMRLDGVSIQGNSSATVMGSLLHLQGLFAGTRVSNSGTYLCNANCLEVDAGTSELFSSDLVFDNDNFADTSTSTHGGAVVTINSVTSSGGLANILFLGGAIQNNGIHNPLLVINGQGGTQLQGITFYNVDFELSAATTGGSWSNVDPIQITDASNIYFSHLRLFGNINSTYQTHAVDLSQTISNNVYGINIQGMTSITASGWTCLINNTVNSKCETGYASGNGNTALPPYQFGGNFIPNITQTNTAPSGSCVNGSIWSNSAGTTTSNTIYQCVAGAWTAFGGGGGSPTGAAGGQLSGTYPNPGLATSISTTNITATGSLTDGALTPGDCLQASTGGLITTTGSSCGGSGGPPTGTAGGVLSGTYPNPGLATSISTTNITATSSLTDNGLTSGDCVQAGTSGLLTSSSGPCGGSPGGSTTQVQVNSSGLFTGYSNFTYNGSTLIVPTVSVPSTTGAFNWASSGTQNVGFSNPSAGVLDLDTVTPNNRAGALNMGLLNVAEIITPEINFFGANTNLVTVTASGSTAAYQLILPPVAPNGQYLYCLGTGGGACSWQTPTSAAGGSNTQVQYNNSNALAGDSTFTFNNSTKTLTEQNNIVGPLGTAISGTNYNSGIYQWNGSYWNGSAAAADSFQCQDIVTPGTNPFTLLNCYHSGSSGGSEVQWDVNTITLGTMGVVSGGYSFIQEDVQPTFYPEMGINYFNQVFYADGFANGTGNFNGIGQATITFSSTTDAAQCQSVSYSGNYYLALATPNHTTTPGSNLNIWWPVPQAGATTPLDCAWYLAEAYKHNTHFNALVMVGSGIHYTNGLVDLVDGSSYDDENAVSLIGCGDKCSYIQYSGSTAIPMINRPTGGANYASMTVRGVTLDGNTTASAAIEVGTLGQSYFENFSAGNIVGGSDHVLEFGHSGGDAFQVFVSNINIGIYPDTGTQNCGVFTANIVSGSITSYTVNNGGNCYNNYPYPNEITGVLVQGYKGGTSNKPCTVMPTGMVATIVGNAVTAISEGTNSGGSGCSGTVDVQVYQTKNVNYGAVFNNSDSTIKDIISYIGATAAFNTGGMGDGTAIHLHPSVVPNGVITIGGLHLVGTEIDDVGGFGIQIQAPFTQEGTPIVGTNAYIGGNRLLPGSHIYEWTYAPNANDPVNISASGSLCSANPGGGVPTDWQEFVLPSGTINSPSDYINKAPQGLSVLGNDTSCGQAMGDYDPGITLGSLTVNALAGNSLTINPGGTATSSTNYNSGNTNSVSSYWNGSSASSCAIGWANQLNSGTNPAGQYNLVTSGCVGAVGVNLGYNNFSANGQIVGYGGLYTAAGTNVWLGGTVGYSLGTAIASASTIAPVTNVTHITGSATVNTITMPTSCVPSAPWVCSISLISDAGFLTGTSGNIADGITTVAGTLYILDYDGNTSKWYITGGGSGGGGGAVSSVSNSDGSLTVTPTTGSVVASLNMANANTWTVTQNFNTGTAIQTNGDVVIQNAHNLLLRNPGGSQQDIYAPSSLSAWFMYDAVNSIYEQELYSQTSGSIAKGPVYTSDSCVQWGSLPAGSASPTIQGFLCEPSANHYSFGSTSTGVNGTLTMGETVLNGSTSGNVGLLAAATTTNYSITFPAADPSANNSSLLCSTSGVCSWGTIGGAVPASYSTSVTYVAGAIAYDGSGNNYVSLSSGNLNNALSNVTYWHFLGGLSALGLNGTAPAVVFSAGGTPLPTCNSSIKGSLAVVSDAASPTYNGTYTSGGTVTVPVVCTGSAWATH